jgi:hypothetical protein
MGFECSGHFALIISLQSRDSGRKINATGTSKQPSNSTLTFAQCRALPQKPRSYLQFLTFLALAANVGLTGCGSRSPDYFAAQLGQKWDMVADGTGEL